MSSEIRLDGFLPDILESIDRGSRHDLDRFDPVLFTASDRPVGDAMPRPLDPAADHLDPELARRRMDVDEKHRRVAEFLDGEGCEVAILTRSDSIAWFTAGGNLGRDLGSEQGSIALYVSQNVRAVLTDNVQSARVFEEELAALGFQLKERPWHHDPLKALGELTARKRALADAHGLGMPCVIDKLRSLRRPLTAMERINYRLLGRSLTLAVEATCRNFEPGATEAEVAGQVAHRLVREGVVPVDIRVGADDRPARFREPTSTASPILGRASLAVVGRRHGLCASVTRVVSFGPADEAFHADHTLASMVDATCIYFSRPGEPVCEILRRARRIYEKFHHADEWMLDYQGWLIGHEPREMLLLPTCTRPLENGSALCWSPTVGSARSEDTIIIDERGFEVITGAQDWPTIDVMVKGFTIRRPGILERSRPGRATG